MFLRNRTVIVLLLNQSIDWRRLSVISVKLLALRNCNPVCWWLVTGAFAWRLSTPLAVYCRCQPHLKVRRRAEWIWIRRWGADDYPRTRNKENCVEFWVVFLLMLDFYAFWGFLEVTGFSFEIPEGVQAGVTMKAGCLCFPFACAGAKSTRFQVKRLETFLLNRFCKEHGALRCLDPTMWRFTSLCPTMLKLAIGPEP